MFTEWVDLYQLIDNFYQPIVFKRVVGWVFVSYIFTKLKGGTSSVVCVQRTGGWVFSCENKVKHRIGDGRNK